jgi:hypothetical protein
MEPYLDLTEKKHMAKCKGVIIRKVIVMMGLLVQKIYAGLRRYLELKTNEMYLFGNLLHIDIDGAVKFKPMIGI